MAIVSERSGIPSLRAALVDVTLAARYGLGASVWLARAPAGFHCARDIAADLSVPAEVLSKVLRRLLRAGVVAARRGPGGGYCLAAAPSELSVLDILHAGAEGGGNGRGCVLYPWACAKRDCSSEAADAARMRQLLGGLTLADVQRDLSSAPGDPCGSGR